MYEIRDIYKNYHKKQVLRGVSLSIAAGECVGIAGANGCGKSTLLQILSGVLRPNSGSFTWEGHDLLKEASCRRSLLGYVPQQPPLIEELTAMDNLRLWYDKSQLMQDLDGGLLKTLEIHDFLNLPVSKMSGGMKKRLAIGCAQASHPRLLLLDEPSTALDLICKEQVYRYLKEFRAGGGTILLITHDENELSLCDRLFIMKDGVLKPAEYKGDIHEFSSLL